jgi:hypothetical protein
MLAASVHGMVLNATTTMDIWLTGTIDAAPLVQWLYNVYLFCHRASAERLGLAAHGAAV